MFKRQILSRIRRPVDLKLKASLTLAKTTSDTSAGLLTTKWLHIPTGEEHITAITKLPPEAYPSRVFACVRISRIQAVLSIIFVGEPTIFLKDLIEMKSSSSR